MEPSEAATLEIVLEAVVQSQLVIARDHDRRVVRTLIDPLHKPLDLLQGAGLGEIPGVKENVARRQRHNVGLLRVRVGEAAESRVTFSWPRHRTLVLPVGA
eukprot:Amastigsp_a841480_45.p3 type:complete len:101 gc:universal Amastigsp_a841480_45:443-141(-)